ncbi:hypothetical protein GQ457_14G018840 [Hibiscus cannabinus]
MGSNSLLHQISKDKDEAKVWFTGLKALISHGHNWKGRLESRSDGISSEATSPKEHTPSCFSPHPFSVEAFSDVILFTVPPRLYILQNLPTDQSILCRQQGSGHYDGDALGNAFIWGEGTCDGVLSGRIHRTGNSTACSGQHAALVTKKGYGGDKGRVGHGGEEARLVPTCVAALAMGSPVYMHLWNPQADGKLSIRVEGKLAKNSVEEIAYGAYRVAVLTSKTETYPWGKGENGHLGHGDTDDKNSPFLVESLGDKTGQECCLWCMFYCSYLSS